MGRLENKIAVVTGAASGIGRATCIRFAEEGASIVAVDINSDGLSQTISLLNKSEGLKHTVFCGDVSDVAFANKMFSDATATYHKPCDILINCAGICTFYNVVDMDEHAFDDVIRVNLKGTYVMSKGFISTLELDENQPKSVSIVNFASFVTKCGFEMLAHYSASKAGIIAFTQSIGTELAKFGVRCNTVIPGVIVTPMMSAGVSEEQVGEILLKSPMKRLGTAREVANACLFLASEESSFVTCANLEVTGGMIK